MDVVHDGKASSSRKVQIDPAVYISIEFKPHTYFKLFMVKDVAEALAFTPQVRFEITEVAWYDLETIADTCLKQQCPARYRMVSPFLPLLLRWIKAGCPSPARY